MTVLSDQLAHGAAHRATAIDAFEIARRRFVSGDRIDMGALAAQVGISRMTLNRWVGSRDVLLAEINWSLAEPTLDAARARARSSGAQLVTDTIGGFLADVLAAPFMRTFLTREPEIALRILTTARTPFQTRVRSYLRDLILQELEPAQLPLDPEDLAYLIVRIGESFCYVDLITGGQPDADKARTAIAALLGARPS